MIEQDKKDLRSVLQEISNSMTRMNGEKDYIKEVFQNRFSDFEAEVDPQMWDSIQSSMHTPVAQSTVSSGFSGVAITGMVVASLSILLGTGYFLWTSQDSKIPNSELKTEIEQPPMVPARRSSASRPARRVRIPACRCGSTQLSACSSPVAAQSPEASACPTGPKAFMSA